MIVSALWLPFVVSFTLAALLTLGVRGVALRHSMLDVPNARSSHTVPTPRGGGVAIVMVLVVGLGLLAAFGQVESVAYAMVALAGIAVATVGLVDDRRGLSARLRLVVQACAAAGVIVGTSLVGPLVVPGLVPGSPFAWLAALVGTLWLVNLFNFMDGIDGIAGSEAAFVGIGMAVCLLVAGGSHTGALVLAVLIAGASCGFLVLNWPPASIFMGDVGSGFLGLLLGALSLLGVAETGISMWVPVILLGAFVSDATVTLLRRIARGERWHEAHRLHAYQHLSRRAGAHLPVTIGYALVNLVWLLPLALTATLRPGWGAVCSTFAYAPLMFCAFLAGAGQPEAHGGAS